MTAMVHSWNIPKLVQVSKGIPGLFFSHHLWFMGLSRRPAGGPSTTLGHGAARVLFSKAGTARPSPEPPEPPPSRCVVHHRPPSDTFKAGLGPPPYWRPEAKASLGAPPHAWAFALSRSEGEGFYWYTCMPLHM
jgi:hypothetical protein